MYSVKINIGPDDEGALKTIGIKNINIVVITTVKIGRLNFITLVQCKYRNAFQEFHIQPLAS